MGVPPGLLDPAEVAARAAEFRSCVIGLRDGEGLELAEVLPGIGTAAAELLDVAAVAEVVGADPRQLDSAGEPMGANVAWLRVALRRWALRPPSEAAAVAVAPLEPAGFREVLAAASREHYGAQAAELGAAALTDDQLVILTEDPSWAVGALRGAWARVLAERVRRERA